MADRITFWKGVSAGILTGMGIAAALRYLPIERLLARSKPVALEPTLNLAPREHTPALRMPDSMAASLAISEFFSKRDQPESAGNPATLASERTGAVATFLRTGGAPGGRSEAEFLEVPGRPGQRIDSTGDHIDLSRPVRIYQRSLDMGSSG
jgi:hypothetical protein